jgi:hypothetical protein
MNRDKLKLIIKNLELLTETLKAEVYSDPGAYDYSNSSSRIGDVDDYDDLDDDSNNINTDNDNVYYWY